MIHFKYVKDLQIGDTIAVAESNYLRVGFYMGEGRNSVQFITPEQAIYDKNYCDKQNKPLRFCKSYVLQTSQWRIIKVDPEGLCLSDEEQFKYEQARNILIKEGIIKN